VARGAVPGPERPLGPARRQGGLDVNYLLELSAALCLATGALIAWQRERPRLRALLISLLALQVLALAQSSLVPSGLQDYVVDQEREVRQLSRIVAEAEGPVLTTSTWASCR
jgi:hypothetical protein